MPNAIQLLSEVLTQLFPFSGIISQVTSRTNLPCKHTYAAVGLSILLFSTSCRTGCSDIQKRCNRELEHLHLFACPGTQLLRENSRPSATAHEVSPVRFAATAQLRLQGLPEAVWGIASSGRRSPSVTRSKDLQGETQSPGAVREPEGHRWGRPTATL